MADLVLGRSRVRLDERGRRDDLAGRAEPALHCVRTNERMDQWMVAQSFDRRYLTVADGMHERDAGEGRHAVELDGARAAMSFTASDFRPCEAQVLAQNLRERSPDRCVERVPLAVDPQLRQASSPPRCRPGG